MATIREQLDYARQQELLTVEQVALLAQLDPQTIYRKVWAQKIPGLVRLGRTIRFQRVLILPWAAEQQRNRASAF